MTETRKPKGDQLFGARLLQQKPVEAPTETRTRHHQACVYHQACICVYTSLYTDIPL